MKMNVFNMEGLLQNKRQFEHLTFAYSTFDFDNIYVSSEDWVSMYDIEEWLPENCIGEYAILYTHSIYIGAGLTDITVFAFKEEADAVAFKLMWA